MTRRELVIRIVSWSEQPVVPGQYNFNGGEMMGVALTVSLMERIQFIGAAEKIAQRTPNGLLSVKHHD